MDIKSKGLVIDKTTFDGWFGTMPDYDAATGIGKMEINQGAGSCKARMIFVGDDSGAICCYVQPKFSPSYDAQANSNAHFVRNFNLRMPTGKPTGKVELKYTDTAKVFSKVTFDPTNPTATALKTALEKMVDETQNAGFTAIYDAMKSTFVAPSVEESQNIYEISLPESSPKYVFGERDDKRGFIVCGPHPDSTKPDDKSLYFLKSLTKKKADIDPTTGKQKLDSKNKPMFVKDASGNFVYEDIDITKSADILANGGKVVSRLRKDKKGQYIVDTYLKKGLKAFGLGKVAKDDNGDLENWITNNYGPSGNKVKSLAKGTVKSRNITKWAVSIGVATAIAFSTLFFPISAVAGENQADKAQGHGQSQIVSIMENFEGRTLFQYKKDGNLLSAGGICDIISGKLDVYKQEGFWGRAKTYANDTRLGAAETLGESAIKELLARDIAIKKYNSETKTYEPIFVYAVASNKTTEALYNRDSMLEFLTGKEVGLKKAEAEEFVAKYEEGYRKVFMEELSKDNGTGGDVVTEPEKPVVNVEAVEVKNAISSAITKYTINGKKIDAKDINIAYVDFETGAEQVLFANSGNYLYKIDLTNNGQNKDIIDSNEKLIEKIMVTKNVVEAIEINAKYEKLNCKASIKAFQDEYNHDSKSINSTIYVTTVSLDQENGSDLFSVTPTIIAVRNNGTSIEEKEMNTVTVEPGKDSSLTMMSALAILGDYGYTDKSGIYSATQNKNPKNTIYDNNGLEIGSENMSIKTNIGKDEGISL